VRSLSLLREPEAVVAPGDSGTTPLQQAPQT